MTFPRNFDTSKIEESNDKKVKSKNEKNIQMNNNNVPDMMKIFQGYQDIPLKTENLTSSTISESHEENPDVSQTTLHKDCSESNKNSLTIDSTDNKTQVKENNLKLTKSKSNVETTSVHESSVPVKPNRITEINVNEVNRHPTLNSTKITESSVTVKSTNIPKNNVIVEAINLPESEVDVNTTPASESIIKVKANNVPESTVYVKATDIPDSSVKVKTTLSPESSVIKVDANKTNGKKTKLKRTLSPTDLDAVMAEHRQVSSMGRINSSRNNYSSIGLTLGSPDGARKIAQPHDSIPFIDKSMSLENFSAHQFEKRSRVLNPIIAVPNIKKYEQPVMVSQKSSDSIQNRDVSSLHTRSSGIPVKLSSHPSTATNVEDIHCPIKSTTSKPCNLSNNSVSITPVIPLDEVLESSKSLIGKMSRQSSNSSIPAPISSGLVSKTSTPTIPIPCSTLSTVQPSVSIATTTTALSVVSPSPISSAVGKNNIQSKCSNVPKTAVQKTRKTSIPKESQLPSQKKLGLIKLTKSQSNPAIRVPVSSLPSTTLSTETRCTSSNSTHSVTSSNSSSKKQKSANKSTKKNKKSPPASFTRVPLMSLGKSLDISPDDCRESFPPPGSDLSISEPTKIDSVPVNLPNLPNKAPNDANTDQCMAELESPERKSSLIDVHVGKLIQTFEPDEIIDETSLKRRDALRTRKSKRAKMFASKGE